MHTHRVTELKPFMIEPTVDIKMSKNKTAWHSSFCCPVRFKNTSGHRELCHKSTEVSILQWCSVNL